MGFALELYPLRQAVLPRGHLLLFSSLSIAVGALPNAECWLCVELAHLGLERPTGHMGSCCINRELHWRQQAWGLWEFQLGADPNLGVGDIKDTVLEEGASTLTAGVR